MHSAEGGRSRGQFFLGIGLEMKMGAATHGCYSLQHRYHQTRTRRRHPASPAWHTRYIVAAHTSKEGLNIADVSITLSLVEEAY